MKTPCFQFLASYTSGANFFLLPPKTIAEIGTPSGASASEEYEGLFLAETVNREFGCAAGPLSLSYSLPFQSVTGSPISLDSHHGSLF